MQTAEEIWGNYKTLLIERDYKAWLDLWDDNGRFVIAYDRVPSDPKDYKNRDFRKEIHDSKDKSESGLFHFFSGGDADLKDTDFCDKGVYQTNDDDVFFVVTMITITTTDDFQYRNLLLCRITTKITAGNERKIKEILEFGDPVPRQAFLHHLTGMRKKREPIENVRSLIEVENDGGQDGRAVADQKLARDFRITRNNGREESRRAYLDWVADPKRRKVTRILQEINLITAAEIIPVTETCTVSSIVEVDGVRYRNLHAFEWQDESWKCAVWQVTKLV